MPTDWKPNLGACKPKDLHKIATLGYGHLCLREEFFSFNQSHVAFTYDMIIMCFNLTYDLHVQGRIQGIPPPKIGKNMIFGVKS